MEDLRVKVMHYRGDNMRYSEEVFTESCKEQNQELDLCGVEDYH